MKRQTKPKRYAREREFYENKLKKIMVEFGASYNLKYDRWEGAALDFTYKGVTRRFERVIGSDIHYASDCIAQIALGMEKLLWMKREGIFDLDVLTAGLPELPSPLPECFMELQFDVKPEYEAEVTKRFRELAAERHPDKGGSNESFIKLQEVYQEALLYFKEGSK